MAETSDLEPRQHVSVLYNHIISALRPESPGRYVDATVGAGGHAKGILETSAPQGELLGLDLDPRALELQAAPLSSHPGSPGALILYPSSFSLQALLDHCASSSLGVSSMQIATRNVFPSKKWPLDCVLTRPSPTSADTGESLPRTTADILLIRRRRLSYVPDRSRSRPLHPPLNSQKSSKGVGEVVVKSTGTRHFNLSDRTNRELTHLTDFSPRRSILSSPDTTGSDSFHSLEDRIVKQYSAGKHRLHLPTRSPVCTCGHKARLKEITRHPIEADEEEIQQNPRARSARLRVAERLSNFVE